MASIGSLVIDLLAKTGTFETDMGRAARTAEKRAKDIDRSISRMGSRIKGALTGLFVGFSFSKIIEETSKAESALAKLDNAVKNNAGAAGTSTSQLAKFSAELQRLTTFSDESVQEMQALLLSFRQIGGSEFQRAQVAILDLATALGRDLNSSALLVGRALADPVKGMTALSRSGIVLAKDQKDLIKRLTETGRAAEAQQILLGELEKRFGGAAQAARNTFGGALAGLKNAFGDLLEAKGGLPEATQELNKLSNLLADPKTKESADRLLTGIIKGGAALVPILGAIVDGVRKLSGGATELEKLTEKLEFLEGQRDQVIPVVFNFGYLDGASPVMGPAAIEAQIKKIKAQIADIANAPSPRGTGPTRRRTFPGSAPIVVTESEELKKAREEIEKLISSTRAQATAMDDGAEAAIRFRLTQGDLADEMKILGAQGDKLAGQLIAASRALDVSKATEQLSDFNKSLKAQTAGLADNEAAAVRYRLEFGDLADTVKLAGEAGQKLKLEIIAAADAKQQKDDLNDIATALLGINSQIDELQGKSVEAALAQFDKQNEKLSKEIARSGTQADSDRLKVLRDLTQAQAEFNQLQTEAARITADLVIQEERIANSQRTGATSELDSMNQLDAARTKAAAQLDDIYKKQVLIAQASGNPSLIENAKKFAAEIENLKSQTDLLAQRLQSGFEEAGSSAFADFITGAKSAGDALSSFLGDFERQISQLVAKQLIQKLFSGLGGESGSGGVFGALAGLFGGGRAYGGDVSGGHVYRINEREGEFFKPNVSGKVIPLSKMAGGGGGITFAPVYNVRGDVTRRSAQQLAVDTARRQRMTSSRLG